MTHDTAADLNALIAQHPHAEVLPVPREWLVELLARRWLVSIPDRDLDLLDTCLRAYPPPPRHVLITAAETVTHLRRDLTASSAEAARLRTLWDGLEEFARTHATTERLDWLRAAMAELECER